MGKIREVWRTAKYIRRDGVVEIFKGYQVSDRGRVKSLNYHQTGEEEYLKLGHKKQSNGKYYIASLYIDNKKFCRSVHRLVASTFLPEGYFKKAVVDHKDSITTHNDVSNLRWVTQRKNCGTPHSIEARRHNTKIKEVAQIDPNTNKIVKTYFSVAEAGRSLGVNNRTIDRACREKTKRFGYYWSYTGK